MQPVQQCMKIQIICGHKSLGGSTLTKENDTATY